MPVKPDPPEHPPEFPQFCRYLAERSPQPMVAAIGPKHIVRYANPAFYRLLETEDKHLLGRPFAQAVPEGMANGCAPLLDRVFATGVHETLAEQHHGPRVVEAEENAEAAALPSHWSYLVWAILGPAESVDEPPVGVMIQVTDATEIAGFRAVAAAINEALLESGIRQHELAEELERLNVELHESAVHEREAREEAQAANRSKDVFLAMLSHELRTPLNAILGWAAMLGTSADPQRVAKGLTVIERNARALGKLIEDVLDVARIASGKFTLDMRPLEITALVLAAVDTVHPSADAKKITLDVSLQEGALGSLWVMGDPFRLQQAIWNLLTNAIKFTPANGSVTVGVKRLGAGDEQTAQITVTDTGKGIDPKFLPAAFEAFKQAGEGTTRSYGGMGLGLSIVRHVMDAHGGTARAESEGEGRGATLTLELPAVPQSAAPLDAIDAISTADLPRLDGLRVLVVDDEEDARTLAARALQSVGATVVLAASAEEGYRLAVEATAGPDVIVGDIGMPGEDGYSMMRRVREKKAGRELPAVAVTAFASADDNRRALFAGYQVHLPKPVVLHELIAVVAGLAGRTAG